MSGWSVVRWTGALGLAAIVVQLLAFILGISAGAPSAYDDKTLLAYAKNSHAVVTTGLILFFIGFSLFLGFLAGVWAIACAAAADPEGLGATTFGAGLARPVVA